MDLSVAKLAERIGSRTALIGVVGLGYVGLPLVRVFVEAGFRVLGFDSDPAKVAKLREGESYIGHLPSEWITRAVADKRFEPTADIERLAEPDAILICVPTPLTESREPDLQYVEATARQIALGAAARSARGARKHDLPGHDARRGVADPRIERPRSGPRLLSGLQPRARGSGQRQLFDRRRFPKWSAASTRQVCSWRRRSMGRSCRRSCRSRRARVAEAARFWKTPIAR